MIPEISYIIDLPESLVKSARVHNGLMKEAMRWLIEQHHIHRIPQHFQRSARSKYGYTPRTEKYMRYKQRRFGSNRDLVKTGRSEQVMTKQRRITIGGTAQGNDMSATLHMRFPFPGGTGRTRNGNRRGGITIAQMIKEIQVITGEEKIVIARQLHDKYVQLVATKTSNRQRIKI